MPETNGVYIEFYDDEIDLVEVSDTEYFEIFEEGLTLSILAAENIPFSFEGPLEVTIGSSPYPITGGTFTIVSVAARVKEQPTGSPDKIDINVNDVTIYGTQANRPIIAAGTFLAAVGAHSVTTVTDGDWITVDIDEIGSSTPGAHLVVVVRLQRIA